MELSRRRFVRALWCVFILSRYISRPDVPSLAVFSFVLTTYSLLPHPCAPQQSSPPSASFSQQSLTSYLQSKSLPTAPPLITMAPLTRTMSAAHLDLHATPSQNYSLNTRSSRSSTRITQTSPGPSDSRRATRHKASNLPRSTPLWKLDVSGGSKQVRKGNPQPNVTH